MKGIKILLVLLIALPLRAYCGQDADELFSKLRGKLDGVKDYVADVRMNVHISFMKVPPLTGKLYFKAPDKMKLDRSGGISIMPKKSIGMSLNALIPAGDATVIDAGYDNIGNIKARVIKVVPSSEQTDIVLTKIWIDEQRLLALKTETTTRNSGTVKMELQFGRFESLGLPDKITFLVDVKHYKLPKGVTMDYDNETSAAPANKAAAGMPKKGKIEITYLNYIVNKGIPDAVFTDSGK